MGAGVPTATEGGSHSRCPEGGSHSLTFRPEVSSHSGFSRSDPPMLTPESNPHSRNLRLHRQIESGGPFLVTKCLQPRLKVIDIAVASSIVETLCVYAEKQVILLDSFAVMLDHWHALFATCDGKSISQRMEILGSWVGKQTRRALAQRGCQWQTGFYEARIRSARQFLYVSAYIEENPVRAQLVKSPSDWESSTANPAYRQFLTRPWPWSFEKDN